MRAIRSEEMQQITYFCSEEIAEKSWMIKNVGDHTPAICYLVEGKDYALLIDSIIGIGNLKAFCETLTTKPIRLVNTHALNARDGLLLMGKLR